MQDINEVLADIHIALAEDLLNKIRGGEATASELNVARQMLKDNSITATPTTDNGLEAMKEALGEYTPDE